MNHALRKCPDAHGDMLQFPWLPGMASFIVETLFNYKGFGGRLCKRAGNNDSSCLLQSLLFSVVVVLGDQQFPISDIGYVYLKPSHPYFLKRTKRWNFLRLGEIIVPVPVAVHARMDSADPCDLRWSRSCFQRQTFAYMAKLFDRLHRHESGFALVIVLGLHGECSIGLLADRHLRPAEARSRGLEKRLPGSPDARSWRMRQYSHYLSGGPDNLARDRVHAMVSGSSL